MSKTNVNFLVQIMNSYFIFHKEKNASKEEIK